MKGNLLKVLGVLALIAIFISFILAMLGMIGAVKMGNGCFLRYDNSGKSSSDSITNTIKLNANANYYSTNTPNPDGTITINPDPAHYGEWLNTNLNVSDSQPIKFRIEGEISLCKAYLPKNNIQYTESNRPGKSNLDDNGQPIEIPRISDVNSEPISLYIDAKSDEWRNIAELYNNDQVMISVSQNYKTGDSYAMQDAFKGSAITADCSEGRTTYDPICGRYSIYSDTYVNDCRWQDNYWKCNNRMSDCNCFPTCWGVCNSGIWNNPGCCPHPICDNCGAWLNVNATAPEAYQDIGTYVFPWSDNATNLFFDYKKLECSNNSTVSPNGKCPDVVTNRDPKDLNYIKGSCPGIVFGSKCCDPDPTEWIKCMTGTGGTIELGESQFQKDKKFWYTANWNNTGPTGLVHRLDTSGAVDKNLGTTTFAKYIAPPDQPAEYNNKYKVIYNIPLVGVSKSYLQYRLWSKPGQNAAKNTGGYVLNIKHTKCFRKNGNSFTDVFTDRGRVQYIVPPYAENPNTSGKTYSVNDITVDADGNAQVTANGPGYLWMRILNDPNDYKNSEGLYSVKFLTSELIGNFTIKVMNPLLSLLKEKVTGAGKSIFNNMVCYGGDASSCSNLFNYIKAMLILYVMSYGAMFLLGMVKISQQDLVIRIVKIAIVSGLLNGKTFEFFNTYLFDLITNFSDAIIANMSGYSLFTNTNTITNPFMFLDAIMSKILFSKTFIAQLMALLSMGLSGLIYFIIVFISTMIVVITALRAVAVYIMAFTATALLIGIGPLFLTFLLFDFTRYLFDNWVRFTFRYMIEPVILMAGIIVLTQLFTIYLDFVTGYSVCWKCAIPIQIPFIGTILPVALLDVPIFCINWFAPWGMDYRSGMMGVNMQHMIALIILAYGMYGYVEFSGKMVTKLTSTTGPSATNMGMSMSDAAETGALKRVGMDKGSRAKITSAAKDRLKIRNTTLDEAEKSQRKGPENKPESKPDAGKSEASK